MSSPEARALLRGEHPGEVHPEHLAAGLRERVVGEHARGLGHPGQPSPALLRDARRSTSTPRLRLLGARSGHQAARRGERACDSRQQVGATPLVDSTSSSAKVPTTLRPAMTSHLVQRQLGGALGSR